MTTYSISLDDVDLALLPLRTHKYNDFLKKEHFEFQVMATDMVELVEDSDLTILYTCHICAIEVPAAFASEHATSVKHRANARIASVAAERTRALITALPPPATAQPKARFCANCATVVYEGHDKTKEHRIAVMHDSLLWDLMKAYVQKDYDEHNLPDNINGNDNIDKVYNHTKDDVDSRNGEGNDKNSNHFRVLQNINNNFSSTLIEEKTEHKKVQEVERIADNCENSGETEKYNEDQEHNVETSQCDNINDNRTDNIQSVNQAEDTDIMENGPNSVQPSNLLTNGIEPSENSVKHSDEEYGEKLRKLIVDKDTFEFKERANLTHIKINDDIINIFNDNFHGYDRIYYSGILECIVCDCILDIEDAEGHKHDPKHMRRIINLGNDDHHVREIDESYSHCIICNMKINNNNVDMHKQILLHTVRKDIHTSKTNNTKPDVTTAKNGSDGIISNDENTANGAINDKNEEAVFTKETSNIIGSEIEYPYEVTATGHVRCVVCECQVPSGVRNRDEHIKGSRHRTVRHIEQDMGIKLTPLPRRMNRKR